ncbi:hypothetical protein PVAND_016182 [Polypedilum vanderplanki]|uniref:Uncharacterized protein n=1 Tax=Polypedilum vanderplanki TaxID=319348 RepID=A0A9J6BFH2_POLVA|nr:hypothetical protein PVAND_016182 [Polypedilum vanderplanki]
MSNNKGIIEKAKDAINDVKETAKEKVKNAKNSFGEFAEEIGAAKNAAKEIREFGQETFKQSSEELREAERKERHKKAKEIAEREEKVKFENSTEVGFESINGINNYYKFINTQRVIFEVFRPAQIFPMVFSSLKRVIK